MSKNSNEKIMPLVTYWLIGGYDYAKPYCCSLAGVGVPGADVMNRK